MEETQELMIKDSSVNKQILGFIYDLDYSGVIGESSQYTEHFNIYRNASPNDIVRVRINSVGGYISTLIQLVNSIKQCQATVITVLESEAMSAAGALFLQGDNFIVGEHATLMIHEPSGGNWDYHSKSKKYYEYHNQHSERVFKDYYKGFLTEDEIQSVLDGNDMWLDSDEITRRLQENMEKEEFDYSELTRKQLQELCDEAGISYTQKNTKTDLINLING